MKRIISSILIVAGLMSVASAQNIDDALRYSQTFYQGTARFNSMGGAFTALGGDLTALSLNPASVAVFRSGEFSFTPLLTYNSEKAIFNGSSSDLLYNFKMGQLGAVMNLVNNTSKEGGMSLNIGYSYNRTNNFNVNSVIKGVNNSSSMADYWATASDGTYYLDLGGATGMAYDAWLIDTLTGGGGDQYGTVFSQYGDNTNSTYGQTVRRVIRNSGYTAEHAFSAGVNLGDKIYVGATFGVNKLEYTGHYEHVESDPANTIFDFNSFVYSDHLEATGTGYTFKMGGIFRPVEVLRLGISFHAPVVYRISEYYYDNLTSEFDDGSRYEFSSDPGGYDYTLTTPLRLNVGVAFQLKKAALFSLDYELVDYSMARFSNASDGYDYYDENFVVDELLKATSNIRAGVEYRINMLYLRGGYALYGSPFVAGEANADSNYSIISGGIGFRQSNFFFDMGYSGLANSSEYFLYGGPDAASASIESKRHSFSTTFGFKF